MTLGQLSGSIRDIKAWPPGAVMIFDNQSQIDMLTETERYMLMRVNGQLPEAHTGRGIVVSNDGLKEIVVMWDEGCKQRICHYNVYELNLQVVRHG